MTLPKTGEGVPSKTKMPRVGYSQDQKTEAIALYVEVGPSEASRQTGVPKDTIAKWATQVGARTKISQTANGRAAQKLRWEDRREGMAHDLGRVAAKAIAMAEVAVDAEDGKLAQTAVTVAAIAIDKAQLLTGGATNRVEHAGYDEREKEIRQLIDQKRALAAGAVRLDDHRATGTDHP